MKRLTAQEVLDSKVELWPFFEKFVERGSLWTLEGLFNEALGAKIQVWTHGGIGCGLTKVITHQNGEKWVHLFAGAGENHKELAQCIKKIKDQSKKSGYDGFQAEVRPGWSRFCKEAGMKETHRIYESRFK